MFDAFQDIPPQTGRYAVCALISCGDMFLAVSRKDNPNDFGLPGGKVDENETLVQALIREALEETGYHIQVVPGSVPYVKEETSGFTTYTFVCTLAKQPYTPLSEKETGVVRFVTPEQLTTGSSFAAYNSDLLTWFKTNNGNTN